MPQVYTQEPVIEVAEETFLLPFHLPTPTGKMLVQPMVLRSREPVLIDTGVKWIREAYLESVFELVEPRDVRWIFISHDDAEHAGNLGPLLEKCPRARIVTNYVGFGRLCDDLDIPPPRVVFVNHRESFRAGDRTLTCLRPPLFDSPATRGLHDPVTGLYYAVDAFGAFLPDFFQRADQVPPDLYADGFNHWNRLIHPWHEVADPALVEERLLGEIRALCPRTLVSYHGPVLAGRTGEALGRILDTITMGPLKEMTQRDIEALFRGRPPAAQARPGR